MRVTFWGVRGSIPTPDAAQARYGGNTPCIEVQLGDDTRIALDAGMGLRWLTLNLMTNGVVTGHRVNILLTHCHWDHIQGIPFTPIMYIPGNEVNIFGSGGPVFGLKDNLLCQMQPDFCPVPNFILHSVGATVEVNEIRASDWFPVGEAMVRWETLPRGNKAPVTGYRIEYAGKVLAYMTDVEYVGHPRECKAAMSLAQGADLLIHDGQFVPEEREMHRNWGHSTYQEALELARVAGCKRLAIFHHDPSRTDDELDAIGAELRSSDLPAFPAREGQVVEL